MASGKLAALALMALLGCVAHAAAGYGGYPNPSTPSYPPPPSPTPPPPAGYPNPSTPSHLKSSVRRSVADSALAPYSSRSFLLQPSSLALATVMFTAGFQVSSNGDDATWPDLEAGTISQVVQSIIPCASPTRGQLVTSLFFVGSLTALFGLTAAFHLPAAGPVFGRYKHSYYIVLANVLAAAAVELATAYWLACSNGRRILALTKVVLPFAYLLLLVVLALGGFTIPFSKVQMTV